MLFTSQPGKRRLLRRTALLERCLRRLEYEKAKSAEAKAAANQLEAERAAMQSIDWCLSPQHSCIPPLPGISKFPVLLHVLDLFTLACPAIILQGLLHQGVLQ